MVGDDMCHVDGNHYCTIYRPQLQTRHRRRYRRRYRRRCPQLWHRTRPQRPATTKFCVLLLASCQTIAEGLGMHPCKILVVEKLLQASQDFIAWRKGLLQFQQSASSIHQELQMLSIGRT